MRYGHKLDTKQETHAHSLRNRHLDVGDHDRRECCKSDICENIDDPQADLCSILIDARVSRVRPEYSSFRFALESNHENSDHGPDDCDDEQAMHREAYPAPWLDG